MRLAVFLEETGMRWGEATALRRCHVDLDADIVKVREVVIDDDGRLMRQAAPKTAAGFRVVPLTPAAVAAVQAVIEKWAPAVTESPIEAGMDPEELIFRSPSTIPARKISEVPRFKARDIDLEPLEALGSSRKTSQVRACVLTKQMSAVRNRPRPQ
ncbi:hypothetical protein [Streptomyces sp. NPDC014744]|uniref:hypothetical protein n=1 Tax=Streptomyces sp. NPDC014744 TaxID=3364903 RepID=UPI0036FF2712